MNSKRTKRLRAIRLYLVIAGSLLAPVATLAAEVVKLSDLRGVSEANFNHDGSCVVVRSSREDVGRVPI